MSPATTALPQSAVLTRIVDRAFAQTMTMIHIANHRPDKRRGDPKVGGHPASCASSMHLLAALHLVSREPQDFVCCKPHASPVDHTLHHLLQLYRRPENEGGGWYGAEEAKGALHRLRKFPKPGEEPVFQSYHARTDPDSFHFLPSGSVGIPPVAAVYLALAYRYAKDHGWKTPDDVHFWCMMGDSEFREGSLLECLPDVAERQLTNCTWIIDYNRQNLDGTRIPNERSLAGADCDRIEKTCLANGWKVIQLRHGAYREELFARPGGAGFKKLFEGKLTDYEFQMLVLKGDANEMRRFATERSPDCEKLVRALSDADLVRAFGDLGGHCMEKLVEAYTTARRDASAPYMILAHTLKGWGLECRAHPSNHSTLPEEKEIHALLAKNGLSVEDPFALFLAGSSEAEYLAERRDRFRRGIEAVQAMRIENRAEVRRRIAADGGVTDALEIDTKLFPIAHTQWMWGQIAAKLVRIGTEDEGGPKTGISSSKELSTLEQRWRTAADMILTLSPDVGTSTNISPVLDQRIYGPDHQSDMTRKLQLDPKHPDLITADDPWTRHIRFEIAEANCMSAAGSFGKMGHYTGVPFFPIMTVYDFFIKRALDQLYYNLYWGAEFVCLGTPSGVTLAPEGAQHSWKSDIQIPNLITWEPAFVVEMDWILSDAVRRQMEDDNEGRRGVLVRGVTRGLQQSLLLENVRKQAASKQPFEGALKPANGGAEWGDALDESSIATLPDAELLQRVRRDCLAGGWYLVDWKGYAGYEPGDNVVNVFVMGSLVTEALEASAKLLGKGLFANVIVVSSPELLLGILGEQDEYRHLREGLGITGDLHAVEGAGDSEAGLVSIAGRRVPVVAVCDGEAGLLDNVGSIVGVKQVTLAVRKFSKCGRPDEVFAYQHLDADSIVEACGRVLSDTALEDLRVSPALLAKLAGRATDAKRDWRALWPEAGAQGKH
ncbi:MAG: pyruvate dehydrogenase [Planctomycetes bacterium]|nr:pyruvate dehydrogenase [Planctomycetota bacterium]